VSAIKESWKRMTRENEREVEINLDDYKSVEVATG
jgi:imidazoleglycerol phosphate dehydratase HisB